MKDGPTSLKPLTTRKRIRKQKKEELKPWPFDFLLASPVKPAATAATKAGKMAKDKAQEAPANGAPKPSAATKTGSHGAGRAQETAASGPTLPKELIEQHMLSVTPLAGADLEELEEAIRGIESPCGNVVWGECWVKRRTRTRRGGPGAAVTLEVSVIYNGCRGRRRIPYSCRKNRIAYGAANWDLPPHGEALTVEDVVRHVRGLDGLVAGCEVVARRSWAVNAVSHGGNWGAS